MANIRDISAKQTWPLRRAVLRKGFANTDVDYPQDLHPAAFHLGVEQDGLIVGVASFAPNATPSRPGVAAIQLRGMAIADDEQGRGHGARLIGEAVARCRAADVAVLWCNARDTAADFYARLGFVTEGEGFKTADTGLPHHVMVLDL